MSFSFLDGIFAIVCGCFLVSTRRLDNREDCFGRDTTASLRGLAMFGIMIHHMHTRMGGHSPVLSPSGYLGVGLFFFISGYGNMLSLNRRQDIRVKWLIDKLVKLYIPFFVAYWIFFGMLEIFYSDLVPTPKELLFDLVTLSLPNKDTWFVKIILLCFLIHWLAKKLTSDITKQNAIITIAILVYTVTAMKMHVNSQWYSSVLCYPLGCIVAMPTLFKKLLELLEKYKIVSMVVFAIAMVMSLMISHRMWIITMTCPIFFQ